MAQEVNGVFVKPERRAEYDSAMLLTRAALGFVAVIILFIGIVIVVQICMTKDHSANTESWAAFTGLIGWVTGVTSVIFNSRFGTTMQSASKDRTIEQQAQTAAVAQAALTGTTTGLAVPLAEGKQQL